MMMVGWWYSIEGHGKIKSRATPLDSLSGGRGRAAVCLTGCKVNNNVLNIMLNQ